MPQPGVRRDQKRRTGRQRTPRRQGAQKEEPSAGSAFCPVSGLARTEQELAPCLARQAAKSGYSLDAKIPFPFMHPASVFEANAIYARVADGADMAAQ